MIVKRGTIQTTYENLFSYNDKKIGIPIFQRFYDWKEAQITQLKDDILQAVKDNTRQIYLLDFIYYIENDSGKIMLADGQQRIVTINNLIKAIKDIAIENNIKISNINYFDISYDIMENDLKYKTHFFKYPTSPFKTIYLNLKDFIKSNINIIENIISVIKNNIFIYMKKCANADDAFEIFQQINTGGKPLSKDEVIKTALDQFSKIYEINFNTANIKEVRQSIISYYKFKKNEVDKKFDNMAIITFLKDFVTKDKKIFQSFVNTISLLKKLEDNPMKYVIDYINRSSLFDVLNILTMKKIDVNIKKEYITKLMIPLCMMSISLTLNNSSPTSFKYLLAEVIKKVKNDINVDDINYFLIEHINNNAVTWKIPFSDFSEKLGSIETPKGLKKGLLIMDIIDKNVSGKVTVPLINLEHVYPQNPNYERAKNGWPSHKEEQKCLIDNIGNYLLLCESVNKSVSNQYITRKVTCYKEIIEKDKVLQTPINTLDFNKFEKDGQRYIKERQIEIASKIREELPLGKVLITTVEK